MYDGQKIIRHGLSALLFMILFLLLNRPEVIALSSFGSTAWYPATGLLLASMLSISAWYAILGVLAAALSGVVIYHQALLTFSGTLGAVAFGVSYAAGAYYLRRILRIDIGLRQRRDVVCYLLVTAASAATSTIIGVLCLVLDGFIPRVQYCSTAFTWFLGDEIGILGVAPFLLIHVLPRLRGQIKDSDEAKSRRAFPLDPFTLLEAAGQSVSLLAAMWLMFGQRFVGLELYYLSFIPIIWVAMRHGIRRVVTALLVLNFSLVVALQHSGRQEFLLNKIGLLMFAVSASGLILGAAVSERHRIAVELTERTNERKAVNKQLLLSKVTADAASRAKSEFLANMSHEIRTPIHGIIGMAELTLDTELSSEQRDYLTTLKSSADSLLRIVNDILDFSKIESGQLTMELAEFDLEEMVASTIRSTALSARRKGLELTYLIDANVPRRVVGDEGRVRQVLLNLIANAIKFTVRGEVAVTTRCHALSEDQVDLHFSVRDTGVGIPPEKHVMIFEAFSQADAGTTRQYGGTGLGLAICARIVDLMQGRIWVDSVAGEGSTFHFIVRMQTADQESREVEIWSRTRQSRGAQPSLVRGGSDIGRTPPAMKILVAEDNPVNQKAIRRMLEKMGHQPTIASNGQEALDYLKSNAFDLVLMDIQMPVLDGLATTQRIRQEERVSGGHVPIIAMTAHATKQYQERCLSMGMDGYLAKPVTREHLEEGLLRYSLNSSANDTERNVHDDFPIRDWDPAKALARSGQDQSLLCEIVDIFLEEGPKQIASLSQAIRDLDGQLIERISHTLKSELAYLDLENACRLAGQLEEIARSGSLGSAPELFRKLEMEISLIVPQMQRIAFLQARADPIQQK